MDQTLMILSGTLCGHELWSDFIDHLVSLGSIQNKHIHHGNLYGGVSMQKMGERIGRRAKSIGKPWILGYSLGGVVALEVVRHYQSYLAGLILVCTKANGRNPAKDASLNNERQLLDNKGIEAVMDTLLVPAYFGNRMQEHDIWVQRVRASGIQLGANELINQRHTFQTRDEQYQYLNQITIPVHIIYGSEDILCTPQHSTDIHQCIPHSTISVYQGVGHDLPWLCNSRLATDVHSHLLHQSDS